MTNRQECNIKRKSWLYSKMEFSNGIGLQHFLSLNMLWHDARSETQRFYEEHATVLVGLQMCIGRTYQPMKVRKITIVFQCREYWVHWFMYAQGAYTEGPVCMLDAESVAMVDMRCITVGLYMGWHWHHSVYVVTNHRAERVAYDAAVYMGLTCKLAHACELLGVKLHTSWNTRLATNLGARIFIFFSLNLLFVRYCQHGGVVLVLSPITRHFTSLRPIQ